MDVVIKRLEESPFSLKEVFDFIRTVYADRKTAGIDFWLSTCTFDEYEAKVQKDKKNIFVAYDFSTNELLGTAALTMRKDKKKRNYGGMSNCATKRDCQRRNIGSMLVEELKKEAIKKECRYLQSTTAVNAASSVNWHLKNGYLKCGLGSGSVSHYYSYLFRMPLSESTHTFYYRFGYRIEYVISCIYTKCTLNEDGSLTWLGKLGKKLLRK